MSPTHEKDLIAGLARDLVKENAPEELPLFKPVSEAFFKNPNLAAANTQKDEPLGFGMADAAVLVTPVILAMTKEVIEYLVKEAQKTLKTEGANTISAYIRRQFKKLEPNEKPESPSTAAPPPASTPAAAPAAAPVPIPATGQTRVALTHEQAKQVWNIAYRRALALKISDKRAKLLADSVLGGLVLSTQP